MNQIYKYYVEYYDEVTKEKLESTGVVAGATSGECADRLDEFFGDWVNIMVLETLDCGDCGVVNLETLKEAFPD